MLTSDTKDRSDPTDFSLVELVTLNALGGRTRQTVLTRGILVLLWPKSACLCGCPGKDRFDFAALVNAVGGKRELVTPPPARTDEVKATEAERVKEEKRRLCVVPCQQSWLLNCFRLLVRLPTTDLTLHVMPARTFTGELVTRL